ncbi:MAG: hypothetical protein ACYS80_05955 [Planctomycetota bacterium]
MVAASGDHGSGGAVAGLYGGGEFRREKWIRIHHFQHRYGDAARFMHLG